MRFKPVPEPPADFAFVAAVTRALPAAAGDVDDCCRHLVDETSLETRDEAATWLAFLQALELATEEPAGYRRRDSITGVDSRTGLDRGRLRRTFRERVDGAERVISVLERADEPLTAEEIVAAIRDARRTDERRSRPSRADGADGERDRIVRLLEWAVLLGWVERDNGVFHACGGFEESEPVDEDE
ncbi:hypothetical protein [Natrinema halophilum]|uniref:Uncharacterized protein n=1 Tax=Natrinema halophilum TaxID=1699371 RepID=A0A7D5GH47_9EURY|nr:hypothetical protein [Natrinema halophilum]QLG48788.1 hypothetical protein HYG82_07975 [Natrinema halophilum]